MGLLSGVGRLRADEEAETAAELAERATIRPEGFALLSPGRISEAVLFNLVQTIGGAAYPLKQGAAAAVWYGERVYQFPLGLLGIAVATVIFPLLSWHAAAGRHDRVASDLTLGLRLVIFGGVPAADFTVLSDTALSAVAPLGTAARPVAVAAIHDSREDFEEPFDPERRTPARREPDRGDAWEPPADDDDQDAPTDGRQLLGWARKQQPDAMGTLLSYGKRNGLHSKVVAWTSEQVRAAYHHARSTRPR